MERKLRRYLTGQETVHHNNEIKSDNDPGNLRLFPTRAAHIAFHNQEKAKIYDAEMIELVRVAASDPKRNLNSLPMSHTTVGKICKIHNIRWIAADETHLTEKRVREALQGRTTLEAAKLLNVSHGTLRRNFPKLLMYRQKPFFLDAHREEICRMSSEGICRTHIARHFGTNCTTLTENLIRWKEQGG
jgi:hypothetical protein